MENTNSTKSLSWLTREPVAIQAVIQSAIGVVIGFGFPVSTEQMGLILVFTASVLALLTRQNVTPFVSTGSTPNVDEDEPQTNVRARR